MNMNNTGRTVRKTVISLLSFLLCVNVIILPLNRNTVKAEETVNYEISDTSVKSFLYELVEKRGISEKHVRDSEGKITAFIYDSEVNIYDEAEEKWIELDNELTEKENYYVNSKNEYWHVEIYKSENRISVSDEQISFSYGLKEPDKGFSITSQEIEDELNSFTGEYENSELVRNRAVSKDIIRYENVRRDTDITVQLYGRNIKENIVLLSKDAPDTFEYSIDIDTEKYELYQESENSPIVIRDRQNREEIYSIEVPYATDSKGQYNDGTQLVLKNETEFIIRADRKWLDEQVRSYPVIIDPVIRYNNVALNGERTVVYSNSRNSHSQYGTSLLMCGRVENYGITKSVIQHELPYIDESMTVVEAKLLLYCTSYSGSGSMNVLCHNGNDSLYLPLLTYSSLEGNYDRCSDLKSIDSSSVGAVITFDITEMASDSGNRSAVNTVVLESSNENEDRNCTFSFTSSYSVSGYPYMEVTYISSAGTEERFSYEDVESISMGEVIISDFTGNLVYELNDITTSGNSLPVNIYHVYNSCSRNENSVYGKGFQLNVSVEIGEYEDILNTAEGYTHWLLYRDEDGTIHSHIQSEEDENSYVRETDDTCVIEITDEGYQMKDGSLLYEFDEYGKLISVTDSESSDSQTYTYDSDGKLTSVTDGSGNTLTFSYSAGLLSSISDGSLYTYYSYSSNNQLVSITETDGTIINISYDSNGCISDVGNINEGRIEIDFLSESPYRVEEIRRYSKNGSVGESLFFEYGSGYTKVSDERGYELTYHFDSQGHTVSTTDMYGYGYYGKYENTSDNNLHSLSYSSDMRYFSSNLLKNSRPSSSLYWTSSLNQSVTYEDGMFIIDQGERTGQNVQITEEGTYTFSALVRSDDSGEVSIGINGYSESFELSEQWKLISCTVMCDENCEQLYCFIESLQQEVQLKNMMLEKGSTVSHFNLLENGSLQGSEGWNISSLNSQTDYFSNGILTVSGSVTSCKSVYQIIEEAGNENDFFTVQLKGKRNSSILSEGRHAGVKIEFLDSNYAVLQSAYVELESSDRENMQYACTEISAEHDYAGIRISLTVEGIYGEVSFDEAAIYRERCYSRYQYDSDGDLIQYRDTNDNVTVWHYAYINVTENGSDTENRKVNDWITYSLDSVIYCREDYQYDSAGRIILETVTDYRYEVNDSRRVRILTYSYDEDGNLIESEQDDISSGELEYTDGNITGYTDIFGNSIYLGYDSRNRLTSITDGNTNQTQYSYNVSSIVSQIQSSGAQVRYTYNALGQVSSIVHSNTATEDTVYSFEYDDFSNLAQIKLGNRPIVQYSYTPDGKTETESWYNSGFVAGFEADEADNPLAVLLSVVTVETERNEIRYEYDCLNRISGIYYNDVLRYEYFYGSDGNLGLYADRQTGIDTRYFYNLSGQIERISGSNGTSLNYEYDQQGNVIRERYDDSENSYEKEYYYDSFNQLRNIKQNSAEANMIIMRMEAAKKSL